MPELSNAILRFFTERMTGHSRVERYEDMSEDDCIFKIYRRGGLPPVTVHLSDAYEYGLGEYRARPRGIDFILIARPEAGFDQSLSERGKTDRIGIGKLGKFMGALNLKDVWR